MSLLSFSTKEEGEKLAKFKRVNQSLQEVVSKIEGESLDIAIKSCSIMVLWNKGSEIQAKID